MAAKALHNTCRGPCRGRTGCVEGKMRGSWQRRQVCRGRGGCGEHVGKASFFGLLSNVCDLFYYFIEVDAAVS